MSSKIKTNPLNAVHTSGIFSDMTVDGPEIGTLVLVVDRAKNLPNRKTIGKQDPYCAARLGKEAKKTTTDIRGGQTPKWDQELRFTVHDSPDYYQLKVSVFSDDKKTELIGENWVDLRDIVVAGGGQSDEWHSLNCRGKYAGEIRIEITYYDSRPKPEKPPAALFASAPVSAAAAAASTRGRQGGDAGGSGSFGPRAPIPKRRPLPSDPVTGQPPAQTPAQIQPPAPLPSQAAPQNAPPLPAAGSPGLPLQQAPEHTQTPSHQPHPPSTYTPNQGTLPPVGYSHTSPQPAPYQQQQQQHLPPSPAPPAPPSRHQNYHDPDPYRADPDGGYEGAPPASHHHRHYSHQSYQSHQNYSHDNSQYGGRDFTPDFPDQQHGVHDYHFDDEPASAPAPTMAPTFEDPNVGSTIEDRPPPPPVHRSRNNSSGVGATDAMFRSSLDSSAAPPTMRRDVLRNEAHRHSVSAAYPGRPTYRPLDASSATGTPASASVYNGSPLESSHQPSPPRHASYDSSYDCQYISDFDTSNDAVGPLVTTSFRESPSRPPAPPHQYQQQPNYEFNEPEFEKVPSPAPLNLAGHGSSFSASSALVHSPATPTQHRNSESNGYRDRTSPSPLVSRDFARTNPSPQPGSTATPHATYDGHNDPYQSSHSELDGGHCIDNSEAYMLPPVPASLVPGVDPSLALELRSRIHQEERRSEQQQQMRYTIASQSVTATPPKATPPRGRQMVEGGSESSFGRDGSPQTYTPQRSQTQIYDTSPQSLSQTSHQRYNHSPGPYSSGVPSPAVNMKPRGASPNPQHTIKRKSVSPAPAPSDTGRRLSGVPFGPDSYDSLNPTVAASMDTARPDYNEASGKIITHDGREIDPSDHLPMESWAPEPEPKPNKAESMTGSHSDYSTPTSGKRQLRIAGRPQSSTGSSGVTFSSADDPGTMHTPTARNRLQKKANRQSVAAIPVSSGALSTGSPQGSTPLAPLTQPRQQQDNFTPPRALARASTFDYPNENYSPTPYGNSPGRMSFGGSAPPIPAKVPIGGGTGITGEDGGGMYGGSRNTGNYRGSSGSYGNSAAGGFRGDGDRSPVMSGALPMPSASTRTLPWNSSAAPGVTGSSGEMALMEEMSRIDIGTGRARRHQGRFY